MAQLQQEEGATRKRIVEARRDAKEAAAAVGATTTRAAAKAQHDAEVAKQEETRKARRREEAVQATALAIEAEKLAVAQALVDAREQEHRMAVQAAIVMKAKLDKDMANQQAAKAAAAELDHRERMLAATREENDRLLAELVHTRQVAQQTADLEAGRIAAQAKATEMAAKKVLEAKAKDALLQHQRHMHEHMLPDAPPPATSLATNAKSTAAVAPAMLAAGTAQQPPPQTTPPSYTRDRESTPRHRSEEPYRPRSRRSPLGEAQFAYASRKKEVRQYKEAKKTQRLTVEDVRMEATRLAAVEGKRAMTLTFFPDLHAMLVGADADKRAHGFPAHTKESFLRHLHMQVNNPHAAHQNLALQEHMEHELHRMHGRSQGVPSVGHC